MRVIVDHLAGNRRGQRQQLDAASRVTIGRHPDSDVAFHALEDRDASTRHAELRPTAGGWVLIDLGSSNGTFVGPHRVTEAPIAIDDPVAVQFGEQGPAVRLWITEDKNAATVPAARPWPLPKGRWRWGRRATWIGAAVIVLAISAGIAVMLRHLR